MKSSNNTCILVFIDWFRPAYKAGGPIQSVVNIVNNLKEFEFWICTSDKDIDSKNKLDAVEINKWTQFSKNCKVIYLSEEQRNKSYFIKIYSQIQPSVIYFNSMFSKQFTLVPYAALRKKNSKIILAPRGMLGEGPLHSKPIKKNIFIRITKTLNYFNSVIWHVSSSKEAADVKKNYGNNASTKVAPNLSVINQIGFNMSEKKIGTLSLFTISRISPIKNIHKTLDFLDSLYKGTIFFNIYGPIEDTKYWEECLEKISDLPANIHVSHMGDLHPNKVQKTINQHHFLIMPTEHENYGHSIVESFQACKPVIISDRTPWLNLAEKKAGWDIPLNDRDKYIQIIQNALDMDQDTYAMYSRNALNYGIAISQDKTVLEANRILFSSQ